jgi:hypothetical protein
MNHGYRLGAGGLGSGVVSDKAQREKLHLICRGLPRRSLHISVVYRKLAESLYIEEAVGWARYGRAFFPVDRNQRFTAAEPASDSSSRLAPHPATAAKLPNLFLRGA